MSYLKGKTVKITVLITLIILIISVSESSTVIFSAATSSNHSSAEKEILCDIKYDIRIEHFSKINVIETFKVLNKINATVSKLYITLPRSSKNVKVMDSLGELVSTIRWGEEFQYRRVEVSLRRPLEPNETRTFTANYELNFDDHVSVIDPFNFSFKFEIVKEINMTINNLSLVISLPDCAYLTKEHSQGLNYEVQRDFYNEKIIYKSLNIAGDYGGPIILDYHVSPLSPSLRPTLWATVISVLSVVVLTVYLRKAPKIVEAEASRELIRTFIEKYKEKIGIMLQIERLEEERRMGRVSRKSYIKRKGKLALNLPALDRDLAELKEKILKEEPKAKEIIERIEIAEAELEVIRKDFERIENALKRRDLSRETYIRLVRDYRKRSDQARNRIYEELNNLQDFL